jgi:hypothetical protein
MLWALKEKESVPQIKSNQPDHQKTSSKSHQNSPLQPGTLKTESSTQQNQEENRSSVEAVLRHDEYRKLDIDFKECQAQLKECKEKLQLKSEEVFLMQLKMKETGGQEVKQSNMNAYILKLEDTITSLSEELSGLKHEGSS